MKYIKSILTVYFCFLSLLCHAQEKQLLTFDTYLHNVRKANIDYLVEKYNVDIAQAEVKAAKVFPDPELSVSYANNQNWNLEMGYGVDAELSYTLELGGKRKARVRVAQSEKEMTEALLEDYFRNLRADATLHFLTAVKQQKLYEIQQESYRQILELANADSLRFRMGLITETDARQSKLEAATMRNEVYASEGDLREVLVRLLLFQGHTNQAIPDSIVGTLDYRIRYFDLSTLITAAQNNRADLQAALKSKEVSHNNLRLAKADRAIDLGLSVGAGYASIVRNEIAPAPEFWGVTAGVTIPLKFSNANKGALQAARLTVEQSKKQYEAVELQIHTDVMQAYNTYTTECRKIEQFNTGLLQDAQTILEKKIFSYERGETSILEVLHAQRTYNEIQVSHTETLFACAAALIELERACGIWDIDSE
ncbi:TolC family protein [Parabacteroides sp. 52]|uniref:TolC family protein n=1 Tax=unclassified Parabacteroides TaxID=2649774 RepID=UPI0013D4968C|nr:MULTISPECIES: TolC family protein [unclassified Parabacteroides]MDH6534529.1 cobalt-zinc-cadmium efflux system outer membrane protein [Parabacteroides sp. PM5-20]NDV55021.1 TolC family protein [Parabacteroides sp. 52]